MEPLKIFAALGQSMFLLESPSKALSGVTIAYTTNMCLGPAGQPGRRTKQCHFSQGWFSHSLLENGAKMLAPCNFPMVAI